MPRLRMLRDSALRDIRRLRAQHQGAIREIRSLKQMVGGNLVTVGLFAPPLSVSISPASASGYETTTTWLPRGVLTNQVIATPSGGQAPYTYNWFRVSGEGSPQSPTNARTAFTATVQVDQTVFSSFTCTVTDAIGQTGTATIPATFTLTNIN